MRLKIIATGIILIVMGIILIPFSLFSCMTGLILFCVGCAFFTSGLLMFPQSQQTDVKPRGILHQAALDPTPQTRFCPTCGNYVKFIPQREKSYCYSCQKYV